MKIWKPKKIKWSAAIFETNAIYDGGELFKSSVNLDERIRRGELMEVTK